MVLSLLHFKYRMIDDLPAAIMVTSNEDPNDYWF